jgi:hypothetical protein
MPAVVVWHKSATPNDLSPVLNKILKRVARIKDIATDKNSCRWYSAD